MERLRLRRLTRGSRRSQVSLFSNLNPTQPAKRATLRGRPFLCVRMVSYIGEWVAGLILWRVLQMRPLPGRIFLRQAPNSRPQRPSVCVRIAAERVWCEARAYLDRAIVDRELLRGLNHSVVMMTTCIPFLRWTLPVTEVTTEAFPSLVTS